MAGGVFSFELGGGIARSCEGFVAPPAYPCWLLAMTGDEDPDVLESYYSILSHIIPL
jgi:hypothetical protein